MIEVSGVGNIENHRKNWGPGGPATSRDDVQESNSEIPKVHEHSVANSPGEVQYYDLKKNWPRIKRRLGDQELDKILVRDFNKHTFGRWRTEFRTGMYPSQFESCHWDEGHRGRRPAFWRYTRHAACHWIVNFILRLAMLAEPKQKWRIITSQKHSTVWNGASLLFDFNFQAFGISPDECFELANETELSPGEYLEVYFAEHFTEEACHGNNADEEDAGEEGSSVPEQNLNVLEERHAPLSNDDMMARMVNVDFSALIDPEYGDSDAARFYGALGREALEKFSNAKLKAASIMLLQNGTAGERCWRCRKELFEMVAEGARRGIIEAEEFDQFVKILCEPSGGLRWYAQKAERKALLTSTHH